MTILIILALSALVIVGLFQQKTSRETVYAGQLFVIDGDTVYLYGTDRKLIERMRLATISAPETRGLKSIFEHRAGERAKDALTKLLSAAHDIEIVRRGQDRYGRTLVELYNREKSSREIGLQLADAGYVRLWMD